MKHLSFFYLRKTGVPDSWCRSCNRESSQRWRLKNKDRHCFQSRQWAKNNEDHKRNTRYKYCYDFTLKEYNNLLTKQNNACGICLENKDKFTLHLAVDHNHKTGKVRGLLCARCNKGLGHFEDCKVRLDLARRYLKRNEE